MRERGRLPSVVIEVCREYSAPEEMALMDAACTFIAASLGIDVRDDIS